MISLRKLNRNGVLLVREQIRVVAEGNAITRGFTEFPDKIQRQARERFKAGFEVTEV